MQSAKSGKTDAVIKWDSNGTKLFSVRGPGGDEQAWGWTGRAHCMEQAADHRSVTIAAPLVPRPNAATPSCILPPVVLYPERAQLWLLGWRGRQRGERQLGKLAHPLQSDAPVRWRQLWALSQSYDAKVCGLPAWVG